MHACSVITGIESWTTDTVWVNGLPHQSLSHGAEHGVLHGARESLLVGLAALSRLPPSAPQSITCWAFPVSAPSHPRTTSRDPELNSSSIHRSTVPSFSYLLRHASVLRLLMEGAASEEPLLEAL